MSRLPACLLVVLAACGPATVVPPPPDPAPPDPVANPGRDVVGTALRFDVTALTGAATITFAPSATEGATLEVGDLVLGSVRLAGGGDVKVNRRGAELDLGLAAAGQPVSVDVTYTYQHHDAFDGAATAGYTLTWPHACGNLFPCHSQPADGTTFTLTLAGVPAGKTAVYPAAIPAKAPAYQVAWTIGDSTQLDLGRTTAGTLVSVWYGPGQLAAARAGTAHLVAAFDWLEKTLGPYPFGPHVGSVSVHWGASAAGGMEHHPFWHIADLALGDEGTNVHEAAHGWYGDGIRIACWEDFVLSEGTVSYLAGRALDVVAPPVGAQLWGQYRSRLAYIPGTSPVWPTTCGAIDVVSSGLFSSAPYLRGAFFFRAVALKVGADRLDQALAAFFREHALGAARLSELLATIHQVTGYDPAACAERWLHATTIPAVGPCQ